MEFVENDLVLPPPDLAGDIQGNIVSAYSRLQTELVFVRLPGATSDEKRDSLKNLLNAVAPNSAASHEQHLSDGSLLVNLLVTAAGLKNLGHEAMLDHMDRAFVEGARSSRLQRELNDPPVDTWEQPFQSEFDLLVLLAHDGNEAAAPLSWFETNFSGAYHRVHGNRLDSQGKPASSAKDPHYEPFGFRDGLSNPHFITETRDKRASSDSMARPLSRCLSRDPASKQGFGSYFVFRKLRQDLEQFKHRLSDLVDETLKNSEKVEAIQFGNPSGSSAGGWPSAPRFAVEPDDAPSDSREAAALARLIKAGSKESVAARAGLEDFILRRAMGRDRAGCPFQHWDKPWFERQQLPVDFALNNSFDFQRDRDGRICPLNAHVRKVNPRGLTGEPDEWKHVIARRGVPYSDPSTGERGMLFLCAQAQIGEQFEHLQRRWANNDGRGANLDSEPTPGYDNIAAQPPNARNNSDVMYESVELSSKFYDCVRLRGAEYLFAPSLSGLALLTGSIELSSEAVDTRQAIKTMSAAHPNGLLSLLFHVTSVSAYRTEDNEEIERSFARFAVPEVARGLCRQMEQACIALRRAANAAWQKSKVKEVQQELARLSGLLFDLVSEEIKRLGPFQSRAKADHSRWFGSLSNAPTNWLLLDYVYAFCYADEATVAQLQDGLARSPYEWARQSLLSLRNEPEPEALCRAMADECSQRGWSRIW
jgi:deferrochelatase/peroxidase EfeB